MQPEDVSSQNNLSRFQGKKKGIIKKSTDPLFERVLSNESALKDNEAENTEIPDVRSSFNQ